MKHSYTERITELDGIRGFCTLLVVVSHYVHLVAVQSANPTVRALGGPLDALMGVMDVFFALSGFLIGGILLDVRDSPNYFKTFYFRRILRIFPLFYVVLLAFVATRVGAYLFNATSLQWLITRPVGTFAGQDALWIASYAVYAQNFAMSWAGDYGAYWMAPTWSLAVEEQFYLTLPFVIRFFPRQHLAKLVVVCIIAAPLMRCGIVLSGRSNQVLQYVLTPLRFDSLGIGVLTAILWRSETAWAKVQKMKGVILAVMAVCFVVLFGVYSRKLNLPRPVLIPLFYFSQAVFYAGALWLALAFRDGLLAKFLRIKAFGKVGEFSYGLYLMHVPMLGLLHALVFRAAPSIDTLGGILVTAAAALLAMLLAKLSWEVLERPLLKRGHRFTY